MIITPESELGKELAKHEQFAGRITDTPGNPYRFRPYPAMLYRAAKLNGQLRCMTGDPDVFLFNGQNAMNDYDRACQAVARFNASCQLTVNDDQERQKAFESGWRETPQAALAFAEQVELDISTAAAETAAAAQGMTDKAKRELKAADAETSDHVTDVTGTPKSRRGRAASKKSNAVAPEGVKAAGK